MMKIFFVVIFTFFMINYNLMAMFYSNLCFLAVFFMFSWFSMSGGEYWINLSGYFGGDMYTFFMVILSFWVMGVMFLTLLSGHLSYLQLYMFMFMLLVLLMFFSVFNLMVLYFFFEVSLIPTFFIVVMWGGNWERLEASMFLMMYMLFISFPLLVYILKVYYLNSSLDINILGVLSFNKMSKLSAWEFFILFGAFFIKLPIYLFHIWLPKAHVEAPVYGSMLLAAVLLKLGGYGVLRMVMLFMISVQDYKSIMMSVGVVGAVYMSILCLIQVDMKSLVAYSSVVHMNFMLAVILIMSKFSQMAAYIVMVSHGLCSSGLFFFVDVFYKRTYSRLIMLNKGFFSLMPSIGLWWFLLCASNFSFPLSLNFLGEIMLIMMMLSWGGSFFMVFVSLISFFSGAYSLYLFSIVFHGEIYCEQKIDSGVFLEHLMGLLHYLPLLLLFLNLFMFSY